VTVHCVLVTGCLITKGLIPAALCVSDRDKGDCQVLVSLVAQTYNIRGFIAVGNVICNSCCIAKFLCSWLTES